MINKVKTKRQVSNFTETIAIPAVIEANMLKDMHVSGYITCPVKTSVALYDENPVKHVSTKSRKI